jgi:uncharacterized cupredoxin-like copper-binding protein
MRIPFVLAAALAFAAPAAAAPDWAHAARAEVKLASFSFTPATIHLRAGQPVILHLVNAASGGHDFSAPAFFDAADIRPEDRAKIDDGSVDLHGGGSADIALVPKAGHYPLKCTHAFHKTFGMSGVIVVD